MGHLIFNVRLTIFSLELQWPFTQDDTFPQAMVDWSQPPIFDEELFEASSLAIRKTPVNVSSLIDFSGVDHFLEKHVNVRGVLLKILGNDLPKGDYFSASYEKNSCIKYELACFCNPYSFITKPPIRVI